MVELLRKQIGFQKGYRFQINQFDSIGVGWKLFKAHLKASSFPNMKDRHYYYDENDTRSRLTIKFIV